MRKLSKRKQIDLVLNDTDFALFDSLKEQYGTSAQRIVEAALTHALAIKAEFKPLDKYANHHRIAIRMDGLMIEQLAQMTEGRLSQRAVLRCALQTFGQRLKI